MNIGFIPNRDKEGSLEYAGKLMDWAADKGCVSLMHGEGCIEDEFYSFADFLVVLGGDGTILRAAAKAAEYGKPLLGINLGRLGYLTDVEKNHAEEALEKILNNDYVTETRMMLEAAYAGSVIGGAALNDICISKSQPSKMIHFNVYINDEYIDAYRADGIIISTPTGSTAYNLSAGGPILKPDGEMIAITPICPHMIYAKSFVISASDSVTIETGDTGIVSMDGVDRINVHKGDSIIVKRSLFDTKIIKTNKLGFYDIVRQKMVEKRM